MWEGRDGSRVIIWKAGAIIQERNESDGLDQGGNSSSEYKLKEIPLRLAERSNEIYERKGDVKDD